MTKSSIKRNLSSTISFVLRQEILEKVIPDGYHLNEVKIAERFGVSRGPVREAIQDLAKEGFVRTLPNGRAIANSFSPSDMDYYYSIRLFIETECIKKILSEPDSDDYKEWIASLEELLKQSRKYISNNDHDRFTQLDSEFHRSFLTRADVKVYLLMWQILDSINMSIMETNRKHLLDNSAHDLSVTYAFHDSILQGLKQRDLNYALSSLHIHLKKGTETYKEIIENISHPFDGSDIDI